jgi:hypothetical protein
LGLLPTTLRDGIQRHYPTTMKIPTVQQLDQFSPAQRAILLEVAKDTPVERWHELDGRYWMRFRGFGRKTLEKIAAFGWSKPIYFNTPEQARLEHQIYKLRGELKEKEAQLAASRAATPERLYPGFGFSPTQAEFDSRASWL